MSEREESVMNDFTVCYDSELKNKINTNLLVVASVVIYKQQNGNKILVKNRYALTSNNEIATLYFILQEKDFIEVRVSDIKGKDYKFIKENYIGKNIIYIEGC